MLNLDSIAVDPDLAESGTWFEYMGGRFLVAREGRRSDALLMQLYNENLALLKSETHEGNLKAIEINNRVFAETILLDWADIVDKDKNPIAYTPELGMKLVENPMMGELVTAIQRFSRMHSNYRAVVEAEVAEDVKNTADS